MNKQLKYNQAKLAVLERIGLLNLREGDVLPSQHELGMGADFSAISLRRALDELADEGVIEKHQGRPMRLRRALAERSGRERVYFLQMYRRSMTTPQGLENLRIFLARRGLELLFVPALSPSPELARLFQGATGLIASGWLDERWRDFLKLLKLPLVIAGNNPFPEDFSSAAYDWRQAAAQLYEHMYRRGCRRIGLVNGGAAYRPGDWIEEAVRDTARRLHSDFTPEMTVRCAPDTAYDDVRAFLNRGMDFDGFCIEEGVYTAFLAVSREFDLGSIPIGCCFQSVPKFSTLLKNQFFAGFADDVFLRSGALFCKRLLHPDAPIENVFIQPEERL